MEIPKGNRVTGGMTHLRVTREIEFLQAEIRNHPQLMATMRLEEAAGRFNTFEDGLAVIAGYVDVVLHGMYGGDEIGDLCMMLVTKLIEKRTPLV